MKFVNHIKIAYPKIKVKLSSSFNCRTVCKHCLTGPTFYFRIGKKRIRKVPTKHVSHEYNKINYPLSEEWIQYRSFDLRDVSFSTNFTAFNPKSHRQRNLSRINNFDDVLYCECTQTSWAFNNTSTKNRKEIEQRKSKNYFDKEFTY
jgi:hypothetical protein